MNSNLDGKIAVVTGGAIDGGITASGGWRLNTEREWRLW